MCNSFNDVNHVMKVRVQARSKFRLRVHADKVVKEADQLETNFLRGFHLFLAHVFFLSVLLIVHQYVSSDQSKSSFHSGRLSCRPCVNRSLSLFF